MDAFDSDDEEQPELGPVPEMARAQGRAAGREATAVAAAPEKANGRTEATAMQGLLGWQKRDAKACKLLIL